MNNILLCGFMGCGKTTVGKRLAALTGREYIDLDREIELEAGMTIPELFERFGEQEFRDREHAAVAALARRIGCIVSTGGGAMTFPRNVSAVSPDDRIVFLDTPFDVCYERIRDSDRPIVRRSTPDELRRLFETRRAAYQTAASVILPGDDTPDNLARFFETYLF